MSKKAARMSVFEQIIAGLEDSIAHSQGKLTLVTRVVSAAPTVEPGAGGQSSARKCRTKKSPKKPGTSTA